jgi:hypothetical protein
VPMSSSRRARCASMAERAMSRRETLSRTAPFDLGIWGRPSRTVNRQRENPRCKRYGPYEYYSSIISCENNYLVGNFFYICVARQHNRISDSI